MPLNLICNKNSLINSQVNSRINSKESSDGYLYRIFRFFSVCNGGMALGYIFKGKILQGSCATISLSGSNISGSNKTCGCLTPCDERPKKYPD